MTPATIITQAMADGVSLTLSPVGTIKIAGQPANVSRWVSVVQTHKTEIIETLGNGSFRADILATYRTAYFDHLDTCPVCRTGITNAMHCPNHTELWQAYGAFRQLHHGEQDRAPHTPATTASPPVAKIPSASPANGYKVVVTAAVRSQSWHRARDAYTFHRMTCIDCKPSGCCNEGGQLKQEYDTQCAFF